MYWTYEYVGSKLLSQVEDEWTMKGIVENTAVLGEKVYLIDAVTEKKYTYEQSNRLSNKIANSLLDLGMQKGDRVGIYMTNRPEYVLTLFAVGKVGLVQVPINSSFREAEIAHIINNAGISTLVMEANDSRLGIIAKVIKDTPCLKNIILQGDTTNVSSLALNTVSLEEMMQQGLSANPDVLVDGSDNYAIFFTSGTTGLPKGAPIKNKTFVLAAQSICAIPHLTAEARNYTCLPMFHANAQLYSMTAMRCMGASLVLSERFSPKKFWQEITSYQATYFNSIGGMMQILDAAFKPEEVPDHTAKFVFVGGTPKDLWERFEKKFRVEIFEGYSMSEVPVLFGNFHSEPQQRKVGSFGKPIFNELGRKVRVVNDNNEELKTGIGELVQKGKDFMLREYWDAPEANKEAFDSEGWFHTGDIVEKDEDGYFYFVDRKKFMIRVAGENVSAYEVEDVVNAYPGIEQCAAIPVPDPIREEEIKVLVRLEEGTNTIKMEDVIGHCAKRLAYFKVPRYIEVVKDFPKTATERIQKVMLKNEERKKKDHGWDRNIEFPNWKQKYYSS